MVTIQSDILSFCCYC